MTTDLWQYREAMRVAAQDVDLTGFEVLGRDGAIGTVDRASNDVRTTYLVVDTGEELGGRQVVLPAATVERLDTAARQVHLDRTRDEVRDAPEFDPDEKGEASFQDALTGYYHGLYDTGL